jgi:hypothetical protein
MAKHFAAASSRGTTHYQHCQHYQRGSGQNGTPRLVVNVRALRPKHIQMLKTQLNIAHSLGNHLSRSNWDLLLCASKREKRERERESERDRETERGRQTDREGETEADNQRETE